MSDTLSIEKLPPSERERLSLNYNTNVSGANTQAIALSNELHRFVNATGYATLLGTSAVIASSALVGGVTMNASSMFLGSGTMIAYGTVVSSSTVNASGISVSSAVSPSSISVSSSTVNASGIFVSSAMNASDTFVRSAVADRHGQTKAKSSTPTFRGRIAGPARHLLATFDRWQIGDRDAAIFLGAQSVSFVNDLRAGTTGLNSRDMQDRARLLLKIYEGVHSLLKVPDAEFSWINSNLPALNNRTLLDIMRGGSLSDLMLVKAYVDHANGR